MTKQKDEKGSKSSDKKKTVDPLERIADTLEGILQVGTISMWMQQYIRLDTAVTADTLANMKIIIHEFVHPDYHRDLRRTLSDAEYEEALKAVLMKQRIYEYLLFVHNYRTTLKSRDVFPDAHAAIDHWLHELVWDRDFRMVHLRQGIFYPHFTNVVNDVLLKEADRAEKLGPKYAQKAAAMRNVAKISEIEKEYAAYQKDSKRYSRIEEAGRLRGNRVPLSLADFRYLWSRGLNQEGNDDDDNGEVN